MSLDNLYTLIGILISVGGVIASLISLVCEQRKQNNYQRMLERRIEYKLRIYEILLDDVLSFDEIASKFNANTPLDPVDQIELRKCIYEMLVEDNIVSYDDGSYTSNTLES